MTRRRLLSFAITPGQRGDSLAAVDLLRPLPAPAPLHGRHGLRWQRPAPVPHRARNLARRPEQSHAQDETLFDRAAYKLRNVIERMFSRLKDWRRIATR